VILWPFNQEGELVGEDSYGSSDTSVFEQVPDEELPAGYVTMLRSLRLASAGHA
jgi:hypothetical protein